MQEDKWILCSEKLPPYDVQVLIYRKICDPCYEGLEHIHKLPYSGDEIGVGFYIKKDPELVAYCRARGDNSWDHCANDYWSTSDVFAWMPLPPPLRLRGC